VIRKAHADVAREFEELSGLCKVKSDMPRASKPAAISRSWS